MKLAGKRKFIAIFETMILAFVLSLSNQLTVNFVTAVSILLAAFMAYNYAEKTVVLNVKPDKFKENKEFVIFTIGLLMLFVLEYWFKLDATFITVINLVVSSYFGSSYGSKKEFAKSEAKD